MAQSLVEVDFREKLSSIGLGEYHDLLVSNGFHTWDSVLRLSEDDLVTLDFKRGHRRKLQRQIATDSGHSVHDPLPRDENSINDNSVRISTQNHEWYSNSQRQWNNGEDHQSSHEYVVELGHNHVSNSFGSTIDMSEWLSANHSNAAGQTWQPSNYEENVWGYQVEDVVANERASQGHVRLEREVYQNGVADSEEDLGARLEDDFYFNAYSTSFVADHEDTWESLVELPRR